MGEMQVGLHARLMCAGAAQAHRQHHRSNTIVVFINQMAMRSA